MLSLCHEDQTVFGPPFNYVNKTSMNLQNTKQILSTLNKYNLVLLLPSEGKDYF